MIKTCIVGASGYTGADLVKLVSQHRSFDLHQVFVSANSADAHKPIDSLHASLIGICDLSLTPLSDDMLEQLAWDYDVIFLATPHEASHAWMPTLAGKRAVILDLSGAYRIKDAAVFEQFYGFAHNDDNWREQAVYGLAEWYPKAISDASVVAVPGCYPTASLSGLKPLMQAGLLDTQVRPVINAISGVSGAGRKAALSNSFCEVGLQAYGILGHRHTPEIEAYLGTQVIFTPHLGTFKRGILATITVKCQTGTTAAQVQDAFSQAYAGQALVRLRNTAPKLDDVVGTPHCDVYYAYDAQSHYAVVTVAIDNVLKGAAAQALQCANLTQGLPVNSGLLNQPVEVV
jgi:N-acetyl-gamma-glutamyl-phosphate reductase